MKRWPVNKAYFWESAPFFRILLPFIAGILCYDAGWFSGISVGVLLAAVLCAGVGCALLQLFKINAPIHFLLANIALFLIAVSLCCISDVRKDNGWFGNHLDSTKGFLARINSAPAERDRTWKLDVSVLNAIEGSRINPVSGDAFIYILKDTTELQLQKGDTIWIPNQWQAIKNAGNPFEFDYTTYARRNNLLYQQFLSTKAIQVYRQHQPGEAQPLTEKVHDICMHRLDVYLPNHEAKGLMQAMLLGDEVNLDNDLRNTYAATGIIHVIAISGANVFMFFVLISWLLWWLKHKKHVWIKYVVALPLVWFYVMMAGAPPSAIRAAIMFSILALGVMLQKNNNSLNTLLATAFFLLCAQPMWFFSLGFQLSFLAVLSLILFYAPLYNLYKPANFITEKLWATICASIAAEVLTAPVVVYYFHLFPVSFIISNVVAYALMGVVLLLGILIIVTGFIPAIATVIGTVAVNVILFTDKIISWLQVFTPVSFCFLRLSFWELLIVFVMIGAVSIFLLKRNTKALMAGLCAFCVLLFSFCCNEWLALHQKRLVVYNLGRENYIELIQGKEHIVVNADTMSVAKRNLTLKSAYANWRAWRLSDNILPGQLFRLSNKTILILDHAVKSGHFPVDYVVVNYLADEEDVASLKRVFTPQSIIIGNNYNQQKVAEWLAAGSKNSVNIHAVGTKGAFILDAY